MRRYGGRGPGRCRAVRGPDLVVAVNFEGVAGMKRTPLKRKTRMKRRRKPMSRLAKRTRDGGSGLWLRKADAAWGALVHLVCGDRCAVGGNCAGHVEAHHIISRSVRATRHLPLNGIGLCSKHHKFDVLCSPHGGPAGFFAWFTETYPGRLT